MRRMVFNQSAIDKSVDNGAFYDCYDRVVRLATQQEREQCKGGRYVLGNYILSYKTFDLLRMLDLIKLDQRKFIF